MTAPLIAASGVWIAYPGQSRPAVCDAGLAVPEGAAIGIVGESGSGKTSLARALVGAVHPVRGEVRVGGVPWTKVRRKDPLRRQVQMIFQDPLGSLNPALTARQSVAEVFRFWDGLPRAEASAAAERLLADVGLGPDGVDSKPSRLSGGQCQRVGIARALACQPQVLVADEPTSALDVSVQAQILNLLDALRQERRLALVLVSHDLGVVRQATDEVLVMYDGRLVEQGPTSEVFTRPRHPYTKALLESRPGRPAGVPVRPDREQAPGCAYAPRCPLRQPDCDAGQPPLVALGAGQAACLHPVTVSEAPPQGAP